MRSTICHSCIPLAGLRRVIYTAARAPHGGRSFTDHTPGITGMWPAPPGAHMGHHGHSQDPTWGHHTHAITTTRPST
eukprot:6244410-Prymnesium_polylepis.1